MFKTGLVVACLHLLLVVSESRGGIILEFTGQPFSDVQGTAFDMTDRITGTVGFSAVGATEAESFILSVTSGGGTLYTFTVSDVNAPPLGVTVGSNVFGNWVNGLPTSWNLTVFGDIFGGAGEEQLSIGDEDNLGDLAALDLFDANSSVGETADEGSWTAAPAAVPEPGSLALAGGLGVLGAIRCWRKRSRPAQREASDGTAAGDSSALGV